MGSLNDRSVAAQSGFEGCSAGTSVVARRPPRVCSDLDLTRSSRGSIGVPRLGPLEVVDADQPAPSRRLASQRP